GGLWAVLSPRALVDRLRPSRRRYIVRARSRVIAIPTGPAHAHDPAHGDGTARAALAAEDPRRVRRRSRRGAARLPVAISPHRRQPADRRGLPGVAGAGDPRRGGLRGVAGVDA